MKRITIVSLALCLSFVIAGCATNQQQPSSESKDDVTVTTETKTSEEATGEGTKASHQVTVETVTLLSISDGFSELTSVVPKLIVDGKEATEINASLSDYLQKTYPMEKNGDYADGTSTRLEWGVMDNIVSIVIFASDTSSDYYTIEAFNYDLDTLTSLEDSEVTKRLDMTDDELFGKAEKLLRDLCNERDYDLEKSIAEINYDKITPFITSEGTPGVLGRIVYPAGSQFAGLESMRYFDLGAME